MPKLKNTKKSDWEIINGVSAMGYRDDSPYRNMRSIDIYTPNGLIDMSETGIPLMANGRYLPPYSGMHKFDETVVKETPLPEAGSGYKVVRSSERKGKTHKVIGPDGTVKFFGDSKLGQHPKDPARKKAFYARHAKNLKNNPYFRAFARKTWEEGGELDFAQDGLKYGYNWSSQQVPTQQVVNTEDYTIHGNENLDPVRWLKGAVDIGGLFNYPLSIAGAAKDAYQGDYTGAALGLIPVLGKAGIHGSTWRKAYTKAINAGIPHKYAFPLKKYGKEATILTTKGTQGVDLYGDIQEKGYGGMLPDLMEMAAGGQFLTVGGEYHRIYKNADGDIMVNHPKEDKGKWDTINLTDKAGSKTVAEGVAATKKWHRENPYAFGGNVILEKYQQGGNSLEGDLYSKILMNRNRNKDFVKRAYAVGQYPGSNMFTEFADFDTRQSHKMGWGEDESGQAYMFPTIMNPGNEAIPVPNMYADYISSQGYKNAAGIKYKNGGSTWEILPEAQDGLKYGYNWSTQQAPVKLAGNVENPNMQKRTQSSYSMGSPNYVANYKPAITSQTGEQGLGEDIISGTIGAVALPGSLPIKATSRLGRIGLEAANMINPLGGFRGSKAAEKLPVSKFESEINWGKWNPDTPKYPELINEYNTIEESTKKAGTWMKNPDGSAFQGTPEQFVQQQSSWFKKAFPNPIKNEIENNLISYHGSPYDNITEFKGDNEINGRIYGNGLYTSPNKQVAIPYAKGDNAKVYELYLNANNPRDASNYIQKGVAEADEKLNKIIKEFGENSKEYKKGIDEYNEALEYLRKNRTKINLGDNPIGNVEDYMRVKDIQVTPFTNYPKSAKGNIGFFDMTNPNIYKSVLPFIGLGAAAMQQPQEQKYGEKTSVMQTGGRAPIYLPNKNDPRIRRYEDSLFTYNDYLDRKKMVEKDVQKDIDEYNKNKPFYKPAAKLYEHSFPMPDKSVFTPYETYNGIYPIGYREINSVNNLGISLNADHAQMIDEFAQPVQPYIYKPNMVGVNAIPSNKVSYKGARVIYKPNPFGGKPLMVVEPEEEINFKRSEISSLPTNEINKFTKYSTSNEKLPISRPNWFSRKKQSQEIGPETQYFDKVTGKEIKKDGGKVSNWEIVDDNEWEILNEKEKLPKAKRGVILPIIGQHRNPNLSYRTVLSPSGSYTIQIPIEDKVEFNPNQEQPINLEKIPVLDTNIKLPLSRPDWFTRDKQPGEIGSKQYFDKVTGREIKMQGGGFIPKAKDGRVVSEIWQDVTGTPWSQAKKLGLTKGSYDENIELRKQLLKDPERFTSMINRPIQKPAVQEVIQQPMPTYKWSNQQMPSVPNLAFGDTPTVNPPIATKPLPNFPVITNPIASPYFQVPVESTMVSRQMVKKPVQQSVQQPKKQSEEHLDFNKFASDLYKTVSSKATKAGEYVEDYSGKIKEIAKTIQTEGLENAKEQLVNYMKKPESYGTTVQSYTPKKQPVTPKTSVNIPAEEELDSYKETVDVDKNFTINTFSKKLTDKKIGVRNRMDESDIKGKPLFYTYAPFKTYNEHLGNSYGDIKINSKSDTTPVIVYEGNKIIAGKLGDYKNTDTLVSPTFKVNNVSELVIDNNNKYHEGIKQKMMKLKTSKGDRDLPIGVQDSKSNKFETWSGGHLLVENPNTHEVVVLHGRSNQLKEMFSKYLKQNNLKSANILETDHKAYSLIKTPKSGIMKGSYNRMLDNYNTASSGSGNFVYEK